MSKANIAGIHRLSTLQEGVLYHHIRNPHSSDYHVQYTCVLSGLDDPQRWQSVWTQLVNKHEVLRSFFTWEKREHPLQIVRQKISLPFTWLDWCNKTPEAQELAWSALQREDKQQGFVLTQDPLYRIYMAQIADGQYRLLWSFQHILLDGWSQRLVFEQALNNYAQIDNPTLNQANGKQQCRFQDFVAWQLKQDHHDAIQLFTQQLQGFTQPSLLVPGDKPVNASNGHQSLNLKLTTEFSHQLQTLLRQRQLTLSALFSAAWALVLSQRCGCSDVLFGTTVSGRQAPLAGIEQTVGLLINTLPLRVRIDGECSLVDWLRQVQQSQVAQRAFEHTPLAQIQKCSPIPSSQVLFDSIVVVENIASAANNIAGLHVEQELFEENSHYPFALLVEPGECIQLHGVYASALMSAEEAQACLTQVESILHDITDKLTAAPGSPMSTLLPSLKGTDVINAPEPDATDIVAMFSRHAKENAQRTALCMDKQSLSFAQLEQQANQLANWLLQQGVKDGFLIAVLLPRSIQTVVTFLAVMKAGAAYIPLDAEAPVGRNCKILETLAGHSAMLLTAQQTPSDYQHVGMKVLNLDEHAGDISQCPYTPPAVQIDPEQLAYVMFTSGSTGTPKGVMVSHANLLYSTWARHEYYSAEPSCFLLMSSFATDSSVAGLYWSLSCGACLLISPPRIEQNINLLAEIIEQYQVSHMLCIPGLYQLLLEHAPPECLANLQAVIVAGEACSTALVSQHQAFFAPSSEAAHLYNEYGPTECTVWATVARLDQHTSGKVPIGRAISHTQVYVLDANMQPVANNQTGELYIGGRGLSQGYLSQPQKNAQAFVPDPFAADGSKLYRSGDLVRHDERGVLYFVGRADNQIKLRGFRFEPEDVEAVLSAHSQVQAAAVFVQPALSETDALALRLQQLSAEEQQVLLKQAASLTTDRVVKEANS